MEPQSLTSLEKDISKKREVLTGELANLQELKEKTTKQVMAEIKVLTIKRNTLLKQIKELYDVIRILKNKKEKVIRDTEEYVLNRFKETRTYGDGVGQKQVVDNVINPCGIIK